MSDLAILLAWALHFTGYPMPENMPTVLYKERAFFVEEACGGKDCSVIGWYRGEGIIYIDKDYLRKDEVLVHEIVHYLQDLSGEYDNMSCEDDVVREREAYRVQQQYAVKAMGRLPRPNSYHTIRCKK